MKHTGRKSYKPGPRDECATPPYAISPLVTFLDALKSFKYGDAPRSQLRIWEPAIGPNGDLVGIMVGLQNAGFTVNGTNYDFLADTTTIPFGRADVIVTNPPFSSSKKQAFIRKCNYFYHTHNVPWALLVSPLTLGEKRLRGEVESCALHMPLGRISYGMPYRGWGTPDKPTIPTFYTAWLSQGLADPGTIHFDDFDMSAGYFSCMQSWNFKTENQTH